MAILVIIGRQIIHQLLGVESDLTSQSRPLRLFHDAKTIVRVVNFMSVISGSILTPRSVVSLGAFPLQMENKANGLV